MKIRLTLCLISCFVQSISAQDWKEKFLDKNVNVIELEKEFLDYWHDKDIEKTDYKEYARMLYKMKKGINEKGFLMEPISIEALKKVHDKNKNFVKRNNSMHQPWTFLGPHSSPGPYNNLTYNNQGVGRITTIAWHPNAGQTLLAGSETGGIWIADDLTGNWFQANTDVLTHLGITHIVYSPDDPNIVYAGTGGKNLNSYGVIKSIDGGYNWQLTNFTPSSFSIGKIFELIVHPENVNDVIVSTTYGTYQTTNGGHSWVKITDLTFQDMAYSRNNFKRLYAVSYLDDEAGFYYLKRNSDVWIRTFDFQSNSSYSRIGLSHADPQLIYLWEETGFGAAVENKLYKSTNEGDSFSYVSTIPSTKLNSRGYFFRSMAVDQWDSNVIFLGAVSMVRSIDGGLNWTSASCDEFECVHVDHWDAHFYNYNNTLFVATDGGVWSTDDYGENWTSNNNGLGITQYYRISSAETNPYVIVGGSQDNGSMKYDRGWSFLLGADGMDNAIDPTDENTMYFGAQNGAFIRSYDGGKTTQNAISQSITGVRGLWVTPFTIDTKNPNILYAGYDRVWKSTNKGETWTAFNQDSFCSGNYSCIQYLDVSKAKPNVIYAATGLNIFRSIDGGVTWNQRNTSPVISNWLETDPKDENRLWVTSYGQIKESIDGGITWSDISANLPNNVKYTAIVCDEDSNDHLYVGTVAAGIYFKDASMTNWVPYDTGLPKVEISDLEIVEKYKLLRAGTYGRGIWQTYTMDYELCHDTLQISQIIDDGIHQSNAILTSDGKGLPGSNVEFNATRNITLKSNFEISETAVFEASIDSCVSLIPPYLPPGYSCRRAFELTGNGQINAPAPEIGNGGSMLNLHAVWYVYTVPTDGVINISSCDYKTRLSLWKGSCQDLELIERTERACALPPYYAGSIIENASVLSGDILYLEWDNRTSSVPFEYSFSFTSN